jgi:hypothetical protein
MSPEELPEVNEDGYPLVEPGANLEPPGRVRPWRERADPPPHPEDLEAWMQDRRRALEEHTRRIREHLEQVRQRVEAMRRRIEALVAEREALANLARSLAKRKAT